MSLENGDDERSTASRGAAFRVVALTVLAALVYGGWAFFVNLKYGLSVSSRAGCVQGMSSATTTLVISAAVERLYAARVGRPLRRAVAWLVPAMLGACLHLSVHLAAGTPRVLLTILPSVVLGTAFSGSYVLGLTRRRSEHGVAVDRAAPR